MTGNGSSPKEDINDKSFPLLLSTCLWPAYFPNGWMLAQEAIVEAIHLDRQEAPQLEIERQNKQDEEKRAAEQKSRSVNKANFHP